MQNKNRPISIITLISLIIVLFLGSVVAKTRQSFPVSNATVEPEFALLRAQVAQKLFIDLRFYCTPKAKVYCQEPMTELPAKLSNMLSNSGVGGVILFSENLESTDQIIALNQSLQRAILKPSASHTRALPLYIGIDQEGGRVSRLPQSNFIGFAGNMAIGATQHNKQSNFAFDLGDAMAKQLNYLGFNVNFAPVLDVNSNPENPIINVRSYSESAEDVSRLGAQFIYALQNKGIAAAAKHFPGHGDTHVDSHIGLPVVSHSLAQIEAIDIAPFRQVISNPLSQPDMIMTAHIQYPALDSTEFVSKSGEKTILPATLSEKILRGLLRQKLGYNGLIITDSLEMAAITQFLSPKQAVIKAFNAGADITLMPFRIASAEDADAFIIWLNELTETIANDPQLVAKVQASFNAILAHKKKLGLAEKTATLLADDYPPKPFPNSQDMRLANALSQMSFTQIKPHTKNETEQTPLPLTLLAQAHKMHIAAIMPDKLRCAALLSYLESAGAKHTLCISQLSQSIPEQLSKVDLFILGDISPNMAFHESKATEGITAQQRLNPDSQKLAVDTLVANLPSSVSKVLVKLRAPYISKEDVTIYDAIFASYDYQVVLQANGELYSPAFETLINTLSGTHIAQGKLPVSQPSNVFELLHLRNESHTSIEANQ